MAWTWCYAVAVRHDGTHQVVEVYFNEKSRPSAWCGISIMGDDMKELKKDFGLIRAAIKAGPRFSITKLDRIRPLSS